MTDMHTETFSLDAAEVHATCGCGKADSLAVADLTRFRKKLESLTGDARLYIRDYETRHRMIEGIDRLVSTLLHSKEQA